MPSCNDPPYNDKNDHVDPIITRNSWAPAPSPAGHCFRVDCASVNMHFSFQRFLNPGNLWKPVKTWEPGDLETYVLFSWNLLTGQGTEIHETAETYKTQGLLMYGICTTMEKHNNLKKPIKEKKKLIWNCWKHCVVSRLRPSSWFLRAQWDVQIHAVGRYYHHFISRRIFIWLVVAATTHKLQCKFPVPFTQRIKVIVEDLKWLPVCFMHECRRLYVCAL